MKSGQTVFVGLSGGVDSSVAALRLKNAGFTVVGVFIKVWHPEFLVCDWEGERRDAMRVAACLDIPFLTCDAQSTYYENVAKEFISEYEAGRTPNPDVLCNQYVKFGAFLEFAQSHGASFVATGHYAQIEHDLDRKRYVLKRGHDTEKDQSYFLWTLSQQQLAQILLPVGTSTKSQIRNEAKQAGLPTAAKKDSQGICFLGHVDMYEFLGHYITLKLGDVLDERGAVIGVHKGSRMYTKGQRHGFSVHISETSTSPYYVIATDHETNTITVSKDSPIHKSGKAFTLRNVHWIDSVPTIGESISFQTRYRQTPHHGTLESRTSSACSLVPDESFTSPAAGQSCVLYSGDTCLGGGIID